MPIAKRPVAVLLSCVILFLTACPSVPTSSTPSDPAPAPVAGDGVEKAHSLREALALSGRKVVESLNPGASVAVISITAPDSFEGDYALEELTLLLVKAQKFRIVDRGNLDVIRAEQRFQLSGEVDDETAVSIGHLIGAAFVVTGAINPWEMSKYLRLRVLDVETGRICAMTSVSYGGDL
jgi:curli biogenesis system outer membrane secretion channel CsgG